MTVGLLRLELIQLPLCLQFEHLGRSWYEITSTLHLHIALLVFPALPVFQLLAYTGISIDRESLSRLYEILRLHFFCWVCA